MTRIGIRILMQLSLVLFPPAGASRGWGRMERSMLVSWYLGIVMLGGACPAHAANSPRLFAPGVISGPADDLSPAVKTRLMRARLMVRDYFVSQSWAAPARLRKAQK